MDCFSGLTRRRGSRRKWRRGAMIAAICAALSAPAAKAETIGGALAKAYLGNPDINQQRAAVRVSDENIPKANAAAPLLVPRLLRTGFRSSPNG